MIHPLLQAVAHVLLPTFLLFAHIGPAHAQDPNADIYGKWIIKAEIGMGAVTSLNDRQAKRIIGQTLLISPEKFEFNGHTCMRPKYERSQEETVSHFDWAWRTDVSDIPFPNPVTIIDTGCNFLYPIRKDRLMIAEENVFFEAVRVGKMPNKKEAEGHR